jgi:osmotically inducible protein OsmC
MIRRFAVAAWAGGVKDGLGTVSCESGVLSNTRFGYKARYEDGPGANPEELIAAAQASCFAMTLSAHLEDLHRTPKSIRATATVTLDRIGEGYVITEMHLDVAARVPGMDQRSFDVVVNRAKQDCPVSKLISVPITVAAQLET